MLLRLEEIDHIVIVEMILRNVNSNKWNVKAFITHKYAVGNYLPSTYHLIM